MVLNILQAQTIINCFKHLNINKPVHMTAVNYVLSLLKGTYILEIQRLSNLYLQGTKEIDKETDILNILV